VKDGDQMDEVLIVGSGVFGLTSAYLLSKKGYKVSIIEKRDHVGGNAYSYRDQSTNIEIHKYGSHIFHTSNKEVWDFVNLFSSWLPYKHTVFTTARQMVYQLPFNLMTLNQVYEKVISPSKAMQMKFEFGKNFKISDEHNNNLEDKAISQVGKEVYELLIRGYTEKQWGLHPKELPPEIINRLPIRANYDSNYFTDTYQAMPSNGYGAFLSNLASATNASITLNTDWQQIRSHISPDTRIIYTGPIDEFFDFEYGELQWRTLDFEMKTLEIEDFQGTPVMNYADIEIPFTRIHEYKHFPTSHKASDSATVVVREFSRFATKYDEKYYPINTANNRMILQKYRDRAALLFPQIIFGGRLGSYQYLDMHMAIGSAFSKINTLFS